MKQRDRSNASALGKGLFFCKCLADRGLSKNFSADAGTHSSGGRLPTREIISSVAVKVQARELSLSSELTSIGVCVKWSVC